jgi:hypothetical protein
MTFQNSTLASHASLVFFAKNEAHTNLLFHHSAFSAFSTQYFVKFYVSSFPHFCRIVSRLLSVKWTHSCLFDDARALCAPGNFWRLETR